MASKNRKKTSPAVMTLISILMGILVGAVILLLAGYNPLSAYWVILKGVFAKPKYMAYTIIYSTPLIMTGLSVAFAFRTGLFNIGAEGQFIIGALTAALAGYFIKLPLILHVPVVLFLAMAAAGCWGAIAGYLKARFGVHEVIATIMLNWIALYFNNFMVLRPAIRRETTEATHKIMESASIELLGFWKTTDAGFVWRRAHPFFMDLLKAPINLGIIAALILAVVVWVILNKTTLGYELRAVGYNMYAAEYGGINVKKSMVTSMGIAGALAGAAGGLHVMGWTKQVAALATSEGYGFDGIAISLIGSSTPGGCVAAGFLFGALKYSGGNLQSSLGAPKEIVNIVIGIIVLFVAMPKLINLILGIFKKKKGAES